MINNIKILLQLPFMTKIGVPISHKFARHYYRIVEPNRSMLMYLSEKQIDMANIYSHAT